jgi:hypothetical protein
VAIIKDEQKLGAVGAQPLERVRMPSWEVPQIAFRQVVNGTTPVWIQRGDSHFTGQHVGPFGLGVPVQLADNAFIQAHIHPRQFAAGRELADGRLPRPSSFLLGLC